MMMSFIVLSETKSTDESATEPAPSPEVLRAQLAAAYSKLAALQLNLHARDFWRMRAAKQAAQVQTDGRYLVTLPTSKISGTSKEMAYFRTS